MKLRLLAHRAVIIAAAAAAAPCNGQSSLQSALETLCCVGCVRAAVRMAGLQRVYRAARTHRLACGRANIIDGAFVPRSRASLSMMHRHGTNTPYESFILQASASDLDTALDQLERVQPSRPNAAHLADAARTVRLMGGDSRRTLANHIVRILENDTLPEHVRSDLLDVLIEQCDATTAPALARVAADWVHGLSSASASQAESPSNPVTLINGKLLSRLLAKGLPTIQKTLPSPDEIIGTIELAACSDWCSERAREECYKALAHSSLSAETRRAVVVRVITCMTRHTSVSPALAQLVDAGAIESLRTVLRTSLESTEFHFGAAAALADRGDPAILPDLEAARAKFASSRPRFAGYISSYVWQIKTQNPESEMVAYLRNDNADSLDRKIWVLRRCVERGIAPDQVRSALLAFLSRAQAKGGTSASLAPLREQAFALGVLSAEESTDGPLGDTSAK